MRVLLLLVTFLFTISSWASSKKEVFTAKATRIVKKLYTTNGNYIKGSPPNVVVIEGKKSGAAYHPSRHKIEIDEAVIDLCDKFGSHADDALAYILAHELAHSYQKELKRTNFWEYHLHEGCTKNEEREADIFGVFNAYLAGYKTVKIVPQVIDEVYNLYELNENLSGYPPKVERMEVAKKVQIKVEELIQIYESANYLSSIGTYDLAAASYNYILQFYQGREIYNNLGVNYTLQALNFANKDFDLYLYPLELDWLTRMKKPKIDRGGEELSWEQQKYRNRLLMQAIDAFDKVKKLDKTYFTAEINTLCVMNLMGDYLETIKQFGVLEKNGKATLMGASKKQQEKAQLAVAIAKAHIPSQRQSALNIWVGLEASKHQEIAFQANYNLFAFQEGKCSVPDGYSCREPFSSQGRIDGVLLHRITHYDTSRLIELDAKEQINVVIETNDNSIVYRYFRANKPSCSLQQIFEPRTLDSEPNLFLVGLKLDVITTTNGYLLNCYENKSIFLMSSGNKPIEWAKYYVY